MRLLLVSTNSAFISELVSYLTLEGNDVAWASSCDAALTLAATTRFHASLVNLDEPAADGTDVLSKMQAALNGTPILAIHGSQRPKTPRTLPISTDIDVLFGPLLTHAKVLSRLRVIMRRNQGYSEAVFRAGIVQLNSGSQQVEVNGTEVELTPREFDLLELLMTTTNTVLAKEAILAHLYGGVDEPPSKIVDVLICKVRSKLAQAGAVEVISTIHGRGYTIEGVSKESSISYGSMSPSRLLPT